MKKQLCLFLAIVLMAAVSIPQSAQASQVLPSDAPSGLRYLRILDNGYAGLDPEERLVYLSRSGETLLSIPLSSVLMEGTNFGGIPACCDDGNSGLFAIFSLDEETDEPKMHLFHFSKDGEILWSSLFQQTTVWGWVHLVSDGQGGVYLVHSGWDDYTKTLVRHFSSKGQILWKKQLCAEGLILGAYLTLPAEDGGLLLHAKAVSKSKGLYKAIQVHIGPDGTILQAAARDYSFRPDYSAALRQEPFSDEILFVSNEDYLDNYGAERICIPLTQLEECSLPTLTLTDAGPGIH